MYNSNGNGITQIEGVALRKFTFGNVEASVVAGRVRDGELRLWVRVDRASLTACGEVVGLESRFSFQDLPDIQRAVIRASWFVQELAPLLGVETQPLDPSGNGWMERFVEACGKTEPGVPAPGPNGEAAS